MKELEDSLEKLQKIWEESRAKNRKEEHNTHSSFEDNFEETLLYTSFASL